MLRALTLALLIATPAGAFTQGDVLQAELLPGWRTGDGKHMAALSLTLAPGWKTYWRSPGEAGIPPVLDFEGSSNLGTVRLHWPSPMVFTISDLQTFGYHDRLILPIEVTVQQPGKPIEMRLHVDLGVCEDICVPAQLDLAVTLPASGPADPRIEAALQDGPIPGRDLGLTAIHCALKPIADGLQMTTSITIPRLGHAEAVVVEPADGAIWVSQSDTRRKGATLTATTDLVPPEGAPFALDRSSLRITVISDQSAVEVTGCPAAP